MGESQLNGHRGRFESRGPAIVVQHNLLFTLVSDS